MAALEKEPFTIVAPVLPNGEPTRSPKTSVARRPSRPWSAWYRLTALQRFIGVAREKVHTDRLSAGLDRLLPHKEAIESHLKNRFGEPFEFKCDLLLYDVTSTYLEGDVENCEITKLGLFT